MSITSQSVRLEFRIDPNLNLPKAWVALDLPSGVVYLSAESMTFGELEEQVATIKRELDTVLAKGKRAFEDRKRSIAAESAPATAD